MGSSVALIRRKSKSPTVSAKKNVYVLRLSLARNGNQRRPISTGIIPTYVPITAQYAIISMVGLIEGAATSTCYSNLVPSSTVSPTAYGSPSFHSNGILTIAD